MIFVLILRLLLGVLQTLLLLLPTFSLASGQSMIGSEVSDFGAQAAGLSHWLNLSLFVQVAAFLITYVLVAGTVVVVIWVYNHLPAKAS